MELLTSKMGFALGNIKNEDIVRASMCSAGTVAASKFLKIDRDYVYILNYKIAGLSVYTDKPIDGEFIMLLPEHIRKDMLQEDIEFLEAHSKYPKQVKIGHGEHNGRWDTYYTAYIIKRRKFDD